MLDIVQSLVPDVEDLVSSIIGGPRTKAMRADLEKIRQADLAL